MMIWSTIDEVKDILSANTDEAVTECSFGLPWYAGMTAALLDDDGESFTNNI